MGYNNDQRPDNGIASLLARIDTSQEIDAFLGAILTGDEYEKAKRRWLVDRELLIRGIREASGAEIASVTGTDTNFVSKRRVHLKRLNQQQLAELKKACRV